MARVPVTTAIDDDNDHQVARPVSRRNLVHDTLVGRMRHAIVSVLHAVDGAVSRAMRSKTRVLFEATSPVSLAVARPVLDRLARDPRIELWFLTADGSWNADRIFRVAGIRERIVTTRRARRMKFDGYINTDFWNMTWLPRRTRRVHLFHGVAGKYGLDAPVRIAPVVASFDRLLFPNRDRLERYAEAGLVDRNGPAAALVGYPKVDCLVDGSLDRATLAQRFGLDPRRPTVLYAPTWSPFSSLNAMGDDIIAALCGLDANVIVKLHDRSYDATERASGGVDWAARLAEHQRNGRVHVAQSADVSPYLVVADALVTDHSSVGFEFTLLDRPIVVIDCPELVARARINPDKVARLRDASTVVARASDVAAAVRGALDHPEARSDARRSIARDLFHGPGSATARAVRVIYELLELRLPERLADASLTPLDQIVLSHERTRILAPESGAESDQHAESMKFSSEVR